MGMYSVGLLVGVSGNIIVAVKKPILIIISSKLGYVHLVDEVAHGIYQLVAR